MTCYQSTNLPGGVTTTGRTGYKTEAECLQACKEGACCEGTTCSVKPQCQCQGAGKTFKGVGTTCTPGICDCKCYQSSTVTAPSHIYATLSGGSPWDGTLVLDRIGNLGESTGDCYAAAGFNWAEWNNEGNVFRGRMGTCCTAYYAFFYDNDGYPDKPMDVTTKLTPENTACGWIFITPDASSVVLPFRRNTVNGVTCWYSNATYVGPTLTTGPGTYCQEGWSAVIGSSYFAGGGQVGPPAGESVFACPRSSGQFIFPAYPQITFHA